MTATITRPREQTAPAPDCRSCLYPTIHKATGSCADPTSCARSVFVDVADVRAEVLAGVCDRTEGQHPTRRAFDVCQGANEALAEIAELVGTVPLAELPQRLRAVRDQHAVPGCTPRAGGYGNTFGIYAGHIAALVEGRCPR